VKKTGVKKMNAEKVVSEKVVENVVEKKVEKKTENGQNGQNAIVKQRNAESLAKLLLEKVQSMDIELEEISELVELARNISDLNMKIQKLSEERLQKLNKAREIYEKLDETAKRLLEFLGLLNTAEIERVIGKTQTVKTQRASNGNGLSGKKINFKGQQYNIASYFLRKYGIVGGFNGLQDWVNRNGYKMKIENDVIYIL
jgi:TolA-binding protein